MHCTCKLFLVELFSVQAVEKFTQIVTGIKIKIMPFERQSRLSS